MTEILDNNNKGEITVGKVYELAADVGRECQSLIELYGQDSASSITLKIISILEQLELLVNEKTELERKIITLNENLVVCKSELSRRAEDKLNVCADLQRLEDQHYQDLEEWKDLLNKARRENRDLKKQLNEKEGEVVQEKVQEKETLKVLMKMKVTVDKQRDEIRAKDTELRNRSQDVEALQQQVERLVRINDNLRRKQEVVETHSRHLIRQKSTLQVDVMALNKNLIAQQAVLEADETEGQIKAQAEAHTGQEKCKEVAKMRDPNRPRFTLNELKKVLVERDEMHLKVLALEEELEQYRPKDDTPDTPANISNPSKQDESSGKNKPSGIRKFFANLFKSNKEKTNMEEELKNWEFLDFDATCDKDLSDADCPGHSFWMERTRQAPEFKPRRNSDTTPSRNNNNVSVVGVNNESSFFSRLLRSTSMTTEMVELTSPPKPRASSSPICSESASPKGRRSLAVTPTPPEDQTPLKEEKDEDKDKACPEKKGTDKEQETMDNSAVPAHYSMFGAVSESMVPF